MGKAAFKALARDKKAKSKPTQDLVINKESEAFKLASEAYDKGARINTQGMTREDFIKSFLAR